MLPRDELAAFLDAEGIETRTAFLPLEQLPAFARLGLHCPVSASWAREGLLLPTGPTLTPEAQGLVADSIRRFLGI
jgi:dTDP-4-amino-4,6-dideoxygalactose transaminase